MFFCRKRLSSTLWTFWRSGDASGFVLYFWGDVGWASDFFFRHNKYYSSIRNYSRLLFEATLSTLCFIPNDFHSFGRGSMSSLSSPPNPFTKFKFDAARGRAGHSLPHRSIKPQHRAQPIGGACFADRVALAGSDEPAVGGGRNNFLQAVQGSDF
jgi:hypothetical protein